VGMNRDKQGIFTLRRELGIPELLRNRIRVALYFGGSQGRKSVDNEIEKKGGSQTQHNGSKERKRGEKSVS